jgi:Type IV secretion-system coupling protein DNA-binding domain
MILSTLLTTAKRARETLRRLPQHVRDRLMALWQANPHTPFAKLPMPVRAEVTSILTSATAVSAPSPRQQASASQPLTRPGLPHAQAPHGHTNRTQTQQHPVDETALTVLGTDIRTQERVTISLKERFLGFFVIGATGTGKTTFDLNMILSDIRQGFAVCLVEPHGDFTRHVIASMPKERLKDVIYLDITDSASSFGLNFFEAPVGADLTEVAKIASFVMHVFEKVWAVGPETPRLAQVLRNTTRLLIENPGMTFAEIPLLLWEDGVREKLVRRVTNTQTKLFWSQYNRKTPRDRDELIASTINKCDAYLNELLIARIVSQAASTVDFRRIMDEGKILLVNLSPQLEEASRLIGAVIIGRLLMAAFSRSDTPEEKRRPFFLYCDEFQRFATSDFATFLAEARKFKIGTTISNQTLEQLDDINRATALQAGSLLVFRVSGEDSKDLASSFDSTSTNTIVGEEPIRATPADPLNHLVRHGSPNAVVARFTADYLMPLNALIRKVGTSSFAFQLGCAFVLPQHVIEGQRQLSEAFATCMREGRADVFLHPWALFVLGGARDPDATYAFFKDFRRELGDLPILGFDNAANRYGRPSFDVTRDEDVAFLRAGVKTSIFDSKATREARVAAFVRMLKSIREAMAILARDPILVDTGQFQPKYQLRTYSDQENLVANALSQLPNYHAKARLLSGEHTIKTRPAPSVVFEQEVAARIRAIKERMLRDGVTKPAAAIEEEVRKRHEALRQRPPGEAPPPKHTNGRRGR